MQCYAIHKRESCGKGSRSRHPYIQSLLAKEVNVAVEQQAAMRWRSEMPPSNISVEAGLPASNDAHNSRQKSEQWI